MKKSQGDNKAWPPGRRGEGARAWAGLLLLCLASCAQAPQPPRNGGVFKPYDYETGKNAEIRLPRGGTVRVDPGELILRRKIELPPLPK